MTERFYIQTFGCQMNEYDSAKMADVLRDAEGARADRATRGRRRHRCSTPARCARRRRRRCSPLSAAWRQLKRERPGPHHRRRRLRREPGGRGASSKRAPFVDLVFGPQTLHRLPEMLERRRASGSRRSTSAFPRSRSSTSLPRAARRGAHALSCRSWKAAASTAASASCRTRAARKSAAPFDDVMAEIAAARRAGREARSRCSARTSTRMRGADADGGDRGSRDADPPSSRELDGIERIRFTTSHPREFTRAPDRRLRRTCRSSRTTCTCRCSAARTACSRDEARLHRARIPAR